MCRPYRSNASWNFRGGACLPRRSPRGEAGRNLGSGRILPMRLLVNDLVDEWYNQSYTLIMKTAISIPDEVFDAAEEMARRLGMSRSQLYVTALREYMEAHRSRGVTARLDQVYEDQDSSLDLRVAEAQTDSLEDEDW